MFDKPKAIIYLRRNTLELYTDKSQGNFEKLQFPATLVSSEEILDQEGFGRFLNDFFTKVTSKNQNTVIVLSDEVTFSESIDLGKISTEQLEDEKKHFFESVPVDLHELSRLEVVYKGSLFLAAANKKLYESILKSLLALGGTVEYIVPAFIFGISQNGPLTNTDIHKILSGHEALKASNLLNLTTVTPKESDMPDELITPRKIPGDVSVFDAKYFFIPAFIAVAIFIIAGGFIFLSGSKLGGFQLLKFNPFAKGTSGIQVSSSPSPISAASPETDQKLSDKSQMAVEVVNGTGKVGQAGKVKAMLENLGFSDITTANADNPASIVTEVEFAGDISEEVRSEVESELKGIFETVEAGTLPSDSTYQIVVTTGTEI